MYFFIKLNIVIKVGKDILIFNSCIPNCEFRFNKCDEYLLIYSSIYDSLNNKKNIGYMYIMKFIIIKKIEFF